MDIPALEAAVAAHGEEAEEASAVDLEDLVAVALAAAVLLAAGKNLHFFSISVFEFCYIFAPYINGANR